MDGFFIGIVPRPVGAGGGPIAPPPPPPLPSSIWLLATGVWADAGSWADDQNWKDA